MAEQGDDVSRKLEELNLTADEVSKITVALKDDNFRNLLAEYAREISDPENRKRYEAELTQLEKERGFDTKFVNPEPGFVLKTSVDGTKKCFVNICQNKLVEEATSVTSRKGNKVGEQWSIPFSMAPGRDDVDRLNNKCVVYDVVFNPKTFSKAADDPRFKKLLQDTALDGIEKQFSVKLDRNNVKIPKMKYKGHPQATVIRTSTDDNPKCEGDNEFLKGLPYPNTLGPHNVAKPKPDVTTDSKNVNNKSRGKNPDQSSTGTPHVTTADNNILNKSESTVPKYTVTHRNFFDMQQCRNVADAKTSTCPQEMVIAVDLPLLKSAKNVSLDVFPRQILLESTEPVSYKLDLALPYTVDEDKGTAKFDKVKRKLVITLPVMIPEAPKLPAFIGDNSPAETIASNVDSVDQEESLKSSSLIQSSESTATTGGKCDGSEICELNSVGSKEAPTEVAGDAAMKTPVENTTEENDNSIIGTRSDEVEEEINPDGDPSEKGCCSSEINGGINKKKITSGRVGFDTKYPQMSMNETLNFISLIFHHADIDEHSVKRSKTSVGSGLQLTFNLLGGSAEERYKVILMMDKKHVFKHTATKVSGDNMVLVLEKSENSRRYWKKLRMGENQDNIHDEYFLNCESLKMDIDQLSKSRLTTHKDADEYKCTVKNLSDSQILIHVDPVSNTSAETDLTSETEATSTDNSNLATTNDGSCGKDVTNSVCDARHVKGHAPQTGEVVSSDVTYTGGDEVIEPIVCGSNNDINNVLDTNNSAPSDTKKSNVLSEKSDCQSETPSKQSIEFEKSLASRNKELSDGQVLSQEESVSKKQPPSPTISDLSPDVSSRQRHYSNTSTSSDVNTGSDDEGGQNIDDNSLSKSKRRRNRRTRRHQECLQAGENTPPGQSARSRTMSENSSDFSSSIDSPRLPQSVLKKSHSWDGERDRYIRRSRLHKSVTFSEEVDVFNLDQAPSPGRSKNNGKCKKKKPKEKNNNPVLLDPREKSQHRTKSAIEFSNTFIFSMDD